MPILTSPDPNRFTYDEVSAEGTTLILVTCIICGAAKIGSHFAGSLEEWEDGHKCFVDNVAA